MLPAGLIDVEPEGWEESDDDDDDDDERQGTKRKVAFCQIISKAIGVEFLNLDAPLILDAG
jgi:hypothetical protein